MTFTIQRVSHLLTMLGPIIDAEKGAQLIAVLLLCLSVTPAPAEQLTERDRQEIESSADALGAQGRRANPSAQQIEWRKKAGEVDLQMWPGEIRLREIRPVLDRFFGALQGQGFDDQQLTSLFADDFRGTAINEVQLLRTETGALAWSRWRTGAEPGLGRAAFANNWEQRFRLYSFISRTEYYVDRMQSLGDGVTQRLSIPFRVTGKREAAGYEDQGEMFVDVRRHETGRHWQIVRLDLRRMETIESPAFFAATALMPAPPPLDMAVMSYVDYFAQGVSVVDFDGDSDLDVFAATHLGMPKLYRNDGQRRFTEVAAILGFDGIRAARSAYFFDWDNDGDQDALVLTTNRMHLLEFREGSFHDVSRGSAFDRMSTTGLTGATIADFDNDGLLDFYVANYGDLSNTPVLDYFDGRRGFKNQLFQNRGNGVFERVTIPAGLDADNARWSFAAMSLDHDDDGDQDLYVVNDYGPNQLYSNRGDMTFEDVTDAAGVKDFGNGMGASLGDLNGDGHEDIYVSNMISHAGKRIASSEEFSGDAAAREVLHRFAKGNTLLLGGKAQFVETETPVLSDAKWAWGSALFDYDNDGDLDIYVANGMYSNLSRKDTDPVFWRHLLAPISTGESPGGYAYGYFGYLVQQESYSFAGYERNRLFQNFGNGTFRDVAGTTGADLVLDSRSIVAADLDKDGDLDLVVANRNEPKLVVLWNELPETGQFVDVELIGSDSNRNGVGARVDVQCGNVAHRRTLQAGSGYLSQGPLSLWFGVGDCRDAIRIRVRWPSGSTSLLDDVRAGARVRVTEN